MKVCTFRSTREPRVHAPSFFDHDGQIAGTAAHEFPQIYPNSGWVEHDPFEILTSQLSAAVDVLGKARLRPRDVVALGITNQRETTVVWDRETGQPVYNAIVWQDSRTGALMKRLSDEGVEEMVRQKDGPVTERPYFSAGKVAWILDNVDGVRARAEAGKLAFGTVGQLAYLESYERQAAYHRSHECFAYAALQRRRR